MGRLRREASVLLVTTTHRCFNIGGVSQTIGGGGSQVSAWETLHLPGSKVHSLYMLNSSRPKSFLTHSSQVFLLLPVSLFYRLQNFLIFQFVAMLSMSWVWLTEASFKRSIVSVVAYRKYTVLEMSNAWTWSVNSDSDGRAARHGISAAETECCHPKLQH